MKHNMSLEQNRGNWFLGVYNFNKTTRQGIYKVFSIWFQQSLQM